MCGFEPWIGGIASIGVLGFAIGRPPSRSTGVDAS
jgi:hypothetical protein